MQNSIQKGDGPFQIMGISNDDQCKSFEFFLPYFYVKFLQQKSAYRK